MASSMFSNPMSSPLLLFLTQLALTLFLTRLLGKLFSYIKQPVVVGEIIAGILMGPSVMGKIPGFTATIWPTELYIRPGHYYDSVQTFNTVALVGLILFMFMMGMELDQGLIQASWRSALPIAIASIIFPFGVGAAASLWLSSVNKEGQPVDWAPPSTVAFTLFSGAAMSFTAFPVLAALLRTSGLLHTALGTQALSCAAVDDILAWCTLAVASSFAAKGNPMNGLWISLAALGYVLVMGLAVRPALSALHAAVERRGKVDDRCYLCFVFMMLIGSAFATEAIGIHSFFGAFTMGLVVPKSNGFADKLIPKMELVVAEVFLPLFFASSGIRTDIGTLATARYWGITLAIIGIACVAKFTPACFMTRLVTRQDWRYCASMGLLMNTRGMVEVIALGVGLSMGILSTRMFTMMILMAIVTTVMTSPALWLTLRGVRDTLPGLQDVRGKGRRDARLDVECGGDGGASSASSSSAPLRGDVGHDDGGGSDAGGGGQEAAAGAALPRPAAAAVAAAAAAREPAASQGQVFKA